MNSYYKYQLKAECVCMYEGWLHNLLATYIWTATNYWTVPQDPDLLNEIKNGIYIIGFLREENKPM